MRDSQQQTPQRDQTSAHRRLKSAPDLKKGLLKVAKKSLISEFKAVTESIAKVCDETPFIENEESFVSLVSPVETPASETIVVSNLTSPSSMITFNENEVYDASDKCEIPRIDYFSKTVSIEAEMVISSLREARNQVLKSNDLGRSRNLLDALLNVTIEEFCAGVHEEKEWLHKLLSSKVNILPLTFVMWILVLFALWFSGSKGLPTGPLPT